VEQIAMACPRIVAITTGQADLSVDLGFARLKALNFEQYFYAENKVLYAAAAAKLQPHGMGAQNNVDFTSISMGSEAMLKACRHAFWLGYMGTSVIHPGWIKPANEGFTPDPEEVNRARRIKAALEKACAEGKGSVSLDGRMVDIANLKYVDYIVARAEAIEKFEAEKSAALKATGEIA
jgi:citrate lyase subunit beta/citryl-CoA lyase